MNMMTMTVFEMMPDQLKWHQSAIKDINILLERKELKDKNIEFDITSLPI